MYRHIHTYIYSISFLIYIIIFLICIYIYLRKKLNYANMKANEIYFLFLKFLFYFWLCQVLVVSRGIFHCSMRAPL